VESWRNLQKAARGIARNRCATVNFTEPEGTGNSEMIELSIPSWLIKIGAGMERKGEWGMKVRGGHRGDLVLQLSGQSRDDIRVLPSRKGLAGARGGEGGSYRDKGEAKAIKAI